MSKPCRDCVKGNCPCHSLSEIAKAQRAHLRKGAVKAGRRKRQLQGRRTRDPYVDRAVASTVHRPHVVQRNRGSG